MLFLPFTKPKYPPILRTRCLLVSPICQSENSNLGGFLGFTCFFRSSLARSGEGSWKKRQQNTVVRNGDAVQCNRLPIFQQLYQYNFRRVRKFRVTKLSQDSLKLKDLTTNFFHITAPFARVD